MEEKIEVMNVSGRFCVFSHKDRQHQRFFQLLPDGSIRDIDSPGHDNERFLGFFEIIRSAYILIKGS